MAKKLISRHSRRNVFISTGFGFSLAVKDRIKVHTDTFQLRNFYSYLAAAMELLKDYPLKSLNTFGVDVKASGFFRFTDAGDLHKAAELGVNMDNFMILGGGSNVLFCSDFEGVIGRNEASGISIIDKSEDYVWIKAGAGIIWQDLVEYCIKNDLGGIENLSLIPGTVGAALEASSHIFSRSISNWSEGLKRFCFSLGSLSSLGILAAGRMADHRTSSSGAVGGFPVREVHDDPADGLDLCL